MKRDTVNYVLVGSFVVVMAIAFLTLMVAVTGRSGPTENYFVYYQNVNGLKFGTGVFYEGYRVGQVESITPEPTDAGMRYKLELSILAGWKIPADSIARVQSSGLISAVNIQIAEGGADSFLQPGDTIDGQGQSDLFAVLNQAAGDFRALSQDGVMPFLDNLNERVNELSDSILTFRHDELTPMVQMLRDRIDGQVIKETVELINRLDEAAQGVSAMVDSGNQERVRSFLTHMDSTAVNLNELVERIESTRARMEEVVISINDLMTDNEDEVVEMMDSARISTDELEIALKTLNQHLGTILVNLEGSTRHMSEFARVIRENPSRLLRGSTSSEPGEP